MTCCSTICHIVPIFDRHSRLNTGLQGTNAAIIKLFDIFGFHQTKTYFKSPCESHSAETFVNTSGRLQENCYEFEEIKFDAVTNLVNLERNFQKWFFRLAVTQLEWNRNIFAVTTGESKVNFI